MFTKLEQRSWVKIEVARGHSTQAVTVKHVATLARRYSVAAVMDLLHRWHWEILKHSLYSPYLSSCDYDLFAKVKEPQEVNLSVL